MPKISVEANQCVQCSHIWLTINDVSPKRCAKCKSMRWDRPIVDPVTTLPAVPLVQLSVPIVQQGYASNVLTVQSKLERARAALKVPDPIEDALDEPAYEHDRDICQTPRCPTCKAMNTVR